MTIPDMRKKLGVTVFVFFRNWGRKLQFFAGFCMCFNCKSKGSQNQTVAAKKLYLEFFSKTATTFLIHFSWNWERKNGGHRARFCSTNKTVSYRHWHSCQTSQIRRSRTIRFSTRPLHPTDWTWCSLLNSELLTRSIVIRFRSSRVSQSNDVTTGSSYLKQSPGKLLTRCFFFLFNSNFAEHILWHRRKSIWQFFRLPTCRNLIEVFFLFSSPPPPPPSLSLSPSSSLSPVISCGDPGRPNNGRRTGTTFTYGSSMLYECDSGYVLVGLSSALCLANGRWSSEPPQCQRECWLMIFMMTLALFFLSVSD